VEDRVVERGHEQGETADEHRHPPAAAWCVHDVGRRGDFFAYSAYSAHLWHIFAFGLVVGNRLSRWGFGIGLPKAVLPTGVAPLRTLGTEYSRPQSPPATTPRAREDPRTTPEQRTWFPPVVENFEVTPEAAMYAGRR